MTTTQERRLHYDPATDTEIANYRAGILDGVMVTATVNVVGSLITRIDQAMERERLIAAEAQVAALTHAAEQARTLHHAQWTQIYALLGWPVEASVSASQVVERVTALAAKPMWLCEFCYARLYVDHLPSSWTLVFACGVCPDCQMRVANDGGYHVVLGGAYAEVPDPRPWPSAPAPPDPGGAP